MTLASAVVAAPAHAAWTVQFRPYEAYATSSWPEVVKIADVTGDGRNDVLLATSFYFDEANDYKLFLFAQRPDGSYASPRRYDASGGIGTGDLDGDGDTDVAVATGEGVKVLWQSGGALGQPQLLVNSPRGALAEVADMDGDGRNDVVVSGDGLHVLTNRGGGAFRYSTIGIAGLGDIDVADVNSDGRLDVVGLGGGMTQYLHEADGTYSVRAFGLTYGANGMGVADTTGDGRVDFAFSAGGNSPDARMVVIPQTAGGTPSTTSQVYTSYDIPEPVEGRDLNGDGRDDVVTLHGGWNAAGYYLQGAGGTLQSEKLVGIPYASHYNLKGFDVGDLDCDGRPDLAIADYNSGLVTVRQVGPSSRPATCPPPDPVPAGTRTPPPPADPPPGGALPLEPGSGPGSGLPGGSGTGAGSGLPGGSGTGAGGSSPPAAGSQSAAGTHYGGAGLENGRPSGTSVSLLVRPDGRIAARVGLGYSCRKRTFPNVVVRLAGVATGAAFEASGSTRLTRRGRLRVRITGTLAGETATGRVRFRVSKARGCGGFSRPFSLRTERVPAGTAAMPAGGSLLTGLTGQAAGGIRLPIALRVTRNGRKVFALWQATMRCGPRAVLTAVNLTPQTRIRPDGTFSRRERYAVRYRDGSVDRFRVVLRGRFLSDGAVGTLRAHMQTRKPGRRYYPCESGTQRWTAAG